MPKHLTDEQRQRIRTSIESRQQSFRGRVEQLLLEWVNSTDDSEQPLAVADVGRFVGTVCLISNEYAVKRNRQPVDRPVHPQQQPSHLSKLSQDAIDCACLIGEDHWYNDPRSRLDR